jgi:3-oxoacyl-[acyl-carrier-protein] synthase-3
MGLVIKSSAFVATQGEFGSVASAVRAAEQCIEQYAIDRGDIDLLVNLGVYRDDNLEEPANAVLIQEKLRINSDPLQNRFGAASFSFDLSNGSSGFLHAAQVISSLCQVGAVRNAIIVTSTSHPSKKLVSDFPYAPTGAAVLVTWDDRSSVGFGRFGFYSSRDEAPGILGYCDPAQYGSGARKHVRIDVDDDYHERLTEFTTARARTFVEETGIDISQIRLVLAQQPRAQFGRDIARAIGIDVSQAPDLYGRYGDLFNSALIAGYDVARRQRQFAEGDTALFAEAGSGMSAAFATYAA